MEALGLHGHAGPVRWLFTGRHGGVSDGVYAALNLGDRVGDHPERVAANRALAAESVGVDPASAVATRACHGTRVEVISESGTPEGDFDGLVTCTPDLALMALAADCMPVLLYDAHTGIVGAVHSGWMGLRDDAVGRAVEVMGERGATSLTAIVGPSICGRCFPVPAERFAEVVDAVPEAAASTPDGKLSLDLRRGVSARLARAGVAVMHVAVCTAESPDHFSYRRDGVTGRQAGIIVLGSSEGKGHPRG